MGKLIPYYRELVETGTNFQGLSILPHARTIQKLVNRTKAVTILDYGSGKGEQWNSPYCLDQVLGIPRPTIYDPAFPSHDTLPEGKFDGVLCSDVLEHVPEEEIDELVIRLFAYSNKFVWASVCCRPAKKLLPNGDNMHVTLRAMSWWREKFNQHSNGVIHVLTETF